MSQCPEGTHWVGTQLGHGGFDGGRALARLLLLFRDIQGGEQVGQEPQDMDNGQLIGGVGLKTERERRGDREIETKKYRPKGQIIF